MEITIKNQQVTAVISTQAAEVISFKANDSDHEWVWCRNPEHWYNCNPILFPFAGPLVDNKFEYKGKEYSMGQHGFARRAVFEVESHDETSAVLSLTYSEETLKVYPFKFKLSVKYSLVGKRLNLEYTVENLDEEKLPFTLGFHPAFNCPPVVDEAYNECYVEFEKEEDLNSPDYAGGIGRKVMLKDAIYGDIQQFFYRDRLLNSEYVTLHTPSGELKVSREGYTTLGFWRKSVNAPFVCIEPWFYENNLEKDHTLRPDSLNDLLPAGEKFNCSYYWEIVK